MLFDKPSKKTTGRLTFYGQTREGRPVWGNFFRIKRNSLQIKAGEFWRTVDKIFVEEGNKNV